MTELGSVVLIGALRKLVALGDRTGGFACERNRRAVAAVYPYDPGRSRDTAAGPVRVSVHAGQAGTSRGRETM